METVNQKANQNSLDRVSLILITKVFQASHCLALRQRYHRCHFHHHDRCCCLKRDCSMARSHFRWWLACNRLNLIEDTHTTEKQTVSCKHAQTKRASERESVCVCACVGSCQWVSVCTLLKFSWRESRRKRERWFYFVHGGKVSTAVHFQLLNPAIQILCTNIANFRPLVAQLEHFKY